VIFILKRWTENVWATLSRGWLQWDKKSLSSVPDGANGACLRVNRRLSRGWYMIEAQIETGNVRQKGALVLADPEGNSVRHSMDFSAGRISKRLLRIDSASSLQIEAGATAESIEVVHFRLVRVTGSFAASRMLTKLYAMHPLYKAKRAQQKRMRQPEQDSGTSLEVLWQDYCNLFDDAPDIAPYNLWIEQFDTLSEQASAALARQIGMLGTKPLVSVLMPVFNPNLTWLAEAIDSVRNQIYSHWQLCIADDASTAHGVAALLRTYAAMDSRIVVLRRRENGHISACSNSALALATGSWIALLDHDDLLSADALARMVLAIDAHPEVRLLYSDEDKIDEAGRRSDPYFKCDWNADLFYSQNMISHLGVYDAALVREVGGFREGYEGSQDYDLALRCVERLEPRQIHHIPRVLYHWRIHEQSTANGLAAKPYAVVAGERALNDHFRRTGVAAKATAVEAGYRVRYQITNFPLVSLIIPTHNAVALLRQCVESVVALTSYPRYEILIVDNRSDDPEALAYLRELGKRPNVRVLRDDRPFNYSAMNNAAVRSANGTVIALLNNDVEVLNGDWLSEMVSHAMRSGVGAVGAKLLYSDQTIQHAGIVLGVHGIAGHAHRFVARSSAGYCGRAALVQSFSAVTGACLVVRKELYERVGGLDEQVLAVACNDVDFCLRLTKAGYRTVWTPYAELYHYESATRGLDTTPEQLARSARENAYMRQQWDGLLTADPFYNPNLSLDSEDFSLAWPPRTSDAAQEHGKETDVRAFPEPA